MRLTVSFITCLGAFVALQDSAALVIEAEKATIRTAGGPIAGGGWSMWTNGRLGQPVKVATAGTYRIAVRARGSSASGVWPEMALLLDGKAVKTVTVSRHEPADYSFEVVLPAGVHEVAVALLNDDAVGEEDRNLYLESLTVSPPPGGAKRTARASGTRRPRPTTP